MKKILFITLMLLVSFGIYAQELEADDFVVITQENASYPGFNAKTYRGLFPVGHGQFKMFNYGGIPGNLTALGANETLGSFVFNGYDGSQNVISAVIQAKTISDSRDPRFNFLLSNGIGNQRPNRMTIIGQSGYVGIGITDPTERLDVNGNIRMRGGAMTGYIPVSDEDGKMTWTDPATLFTPSPWIIIGDDIHRSLGNVGIGTDTPDASLHVKNGDGTGGGAYSTRIDAIIEDDDWAYLEFNAGLFSGITFNDNNASLYSGIFYDNTLGSLSFKTGGVNSRLLIDATGKIGINTDPSTELDVNGQIRMRAGANNGYVPVSDADGNMTWTDPNSLFSPGLWSSNGSNVYVDDTNNVGIGISSPASPLTVGNSTNPEIRVGYAGGFNNKNSGKLIFDEDVSNAAGTCGFEIDHDGSLDELSIISGCILPTAGDTLAIFQRSGSVKFPTQIMVGSREFPTEELDVDGKIRMREGAADGYIPVSSANGTMTWTDPASIFSTETPSEIADADGNTKVQVEESANENIIRFDAGGIEVATMTNGRLGVRDETPDFTLDVSHVTGTPTDATGNGLNIENENGPTRWTLYTWSSGNFSFYRDGGLRGTFNGTSGNYSSVSDRRLKSNIEELPSQMEKIMLLKPSTYRYKTQKGTEKYYGLIAQEVKEIYPELAPIIESTSEGAKEDLYGVTYSAFVPVLIAGMQEQQKELEAKDEEIEKMKSEMADMSKKMDDMMILMNDKFNKMEEDMSSCCFDSNVSASSNKEAITTIELNGNTDQPQLEQNAPNPFNAQTRIRYYIPSSATKGQMVVTDSRGVVLKTIHISETGFGTVFVKAGELAPGTYAYTLFVDGNKVATKQMILVK